MTHPPYALPYSWGAQELGLDQLLALLIYLVDTNISVLIFTYRFRLKFDNLYQYQEHRYTGKLPFKKIT